MIFNIEAYIYLFYCCLSILILYPLTHYVLSNNKKYNTYDVNKKLYIIKNIIKSLLLCYLTFDSINLVHGMYYNTWNNAHLNRFASLYVSNDIMGLLMIPKLPRSTKIHHIITTILLLYSFTVDFTKDNVGRLLFILCVFSSYSFLVNLYLGLRHLRTTENNILNNVIEKIRKSSYYIYMVCCFLNWSIQLFIICYKAYRNTLTYQYFIYPWFLIFIINDDLVLLNWLKNKT